MKSKNPIDLIPLSPIQKQVKDECVFDYDCDLLKDKKCCFKCSNLSDCKKNEYYICDESMCDYCQD